MKDAGRIVLGVVVLGAVLVLMSSLYTVQMTDQVILTQFGKPIGTSAVTNAGLHFKVPFVQEVNRIEKRFLQWDGTPNEMPTKDKTYILVDTFARWRISDAFQYFRRLRDERSALSRLNDILGSETRNAIARHELIEMVRTNEHGRRSRDLVSDHQRTSDRPAGDLRSRGTEAAGFWH
jgi:membrane protease subunit HflC